ncbi:MAG: hypothetical protein Q9191_004596 [Dirinaria sp. TL-2023a]
MDNEAPMLNDADLLSESELRELGRTFAAVSPRGGSGVPEDRISSENPDPHVKIVEIEFASTQAARIICSADQTASVKFAFQTLEYVLSNCLISALDVVHLVARIQTKQVDSSPQVIQSAPRDQHGVLLESDAVDSALTEVFQSFIDDVLIWLHYPDTAAAAGRLASTFIKSLRSSLPGEARMSTSPLSICMKSLISLLNEQPHMRSAVKSSVLPDLLRLHRVEVMAMLEPMRLLNMSYISTEPMSNAEIELRLLAAEVAEDLGLFPGIEIDPKARNEFIALAKKLFLRVKAVVIAQSDTALFHPTTAKAIKFPVHSTSEHDSLQSFVSEASCTEQHTIFMRWYISFLAEELQPTASYQRHIIALEILQLVLKEYVGDYSSDSQDLGALNEFLDGPRASYMDRLTRSLFDLIMDPFDDVRALASSTLLFILERLHPRQQNLSITDLTNSLATMMNPLLFPKNHSNLCLTLRRAERTSRVTGRADHADGLARLNLLTWQLVEENAQGCDNKSYLLEVLVSDLEADLGTTHSNLRFAVANAPLHGRIIAISTWNSLKAHLILCCVNVWEAVKSTLSYDSPEGHLDEADDTAVYDIGPKDTLSFCWRALKESSLLMHALLLQARPETQAPVHGLDHDDFERLGSLSLIQLAELRHKGAFSTVAQTFALCCVQCAKNYDVETRRLPELWYQETLSYLYQHASALTRRSAGLPAMITGILAASPHGKFFDNVVSELQAIALTPVDNTVGKEAPLLPQVHALNCLKDVFSDTRFRDSVEGHVSDALDLAASCLNAEIWEIRNSGLMLLNSLLRRLNGGTDTNSSKASSASRRLSPVTYERYPNLADLVNKLLLPSNHFFENIEQQRTSDSGIMTTQRIIPALEIIERFGIPKERRAGIRGLIEYHMRGRIWPIREKAAKAYAYAVHEKEIAAEAEKLLKTLTTFKCTQNSLHGRLLCIRYLFARLGPSLSAKLAVNNRRLEEQLLRPCDYFMVSNWCSITTAAYFNIIADILQSFVTRKDPSAVNFASIVECKARFLQSSTTIDTLSPAVSSPLDASLHQTFKRCRSLIQQITKLESSEKFAGNAMPQLATMEVHQQIHEEIPSHGVQEMLHYVSKGNQKESQHLSAWFCWLRLAGRENADLSTRIAAADSLRSLMSTQDEKARQIQTEHDLLRFHLAIYDRLIDDDEDIRVLGASLVSEILLKTGNVRNGSVVKESLSASAARAEFLRFLKSRYGDSAYLSCEALRRLACDTTVLPRDADTKLSCINSPVSDDFADECDESIIFRFRPFQDELGDAMRLNTALFVEEKQNLYIDEVEEARAWSQMLIDMQPWKVTASLTSKFYDWTINSLHTLIATAAKETDGPLGWTSKPEVFAMGMRAILAAKVIIHRKTSTSSSNKEETCRKALQDLLDIDLKTQMHDLWISQIVLTLGTAK